MSEYRRSYIPGGTYFFTLTTLGRRPILIQETLRTAFVRPLSKCVQNGPSKVLLGSMDLARGGCKLFSSLVANQTTCHEECTGLTQNASTAESRQRRREGMIWQRRFWEHSIRDQTDFLHHVDYVHYNPVKHGYVKQPIDWPYSTFHHYVREGVYPPDWSSSAEGSISSFGE
jgi:putative transposase